MLEVWHKITPDQADVLWRTLYVSSLSEPLRRRRKGTNGFRLVMSKLTAEQPATEGSRSFPTTSSNRRHIRQAINHILLAENSHLLGDDNVQKAAQGKPHGAVEFNGKLEASKMLPPEVEKDLDQARKLKAMFDTPVRHALNELPIFSQDKVDRVA
jgi:hypothetical protein